MDKTIKVDIEKDYHLVPIVGIGTPSGYINYYMDYLVSPKDVVWSIEEDDFIIYGKKGV